MRLDYYDYKVRAPIFAPFRVSEWLGKTDKHTLWRPKVQNVAWSNLEAHQGANATLKASNVKSKQVYYSKIRPAHGLCSILIYVKG